MKKIISLFLALLLLLSLAACGGQKEDPNAGVYKATSARFKSLSIRVEDVFKDGIQLELKSDGKAVLSTGDVDYNIRWELEGEDFSLIAADSEYKGTLADGTLVLQNVLGSGVDLTLEKEG